VADEGLHRSARVSLVALDVDGTVLGPDGRIAESTRTAVAEARRRGVRVVLASSRGPVALAPIQEALDLADEWFVGFQGALVGRRTVAGLEVLADSPMERCAAGAVEREARARGLSVGRYIGPRWRVPELTEAILCEARGTGEEPLLSSTAESDADAPPHKVMVIADGPDQLPLLTDLAAGLPSSVTGTFSHPGFFEVTAAGVDKGHGLRSLLARLDLSAEQTAAVGDGLNDLGMFAAVGSPIAMGQASEQVRSAAVWVTGSNTEDGVARALAHLGATTVPSVTERPS
jgi:Cof subfamily protein (haloacid dehalogenase superfamily)